MKSSKTKAPQSWCAKCDNRAIAATPNILNACGLCYYHPECFRKSMHCECGFPTTKLIEIGKDCMACRKSISTSKYCELFCPLHEQEAIDQLYLYGRRGIECGSDTRSGCTPISIFQGNGLLHPKIAGEVSRMLTLHFATRVQHQHPERFCMHGDTMYTVPGRILSVVSRPATSTPHNVMVIAADIFGEDAAPAAVANFKKEFPQYTVQADGTIKASSFAHGVSSIVDDASLLKFLERVQNKAHAIAPLIAQYPRAAKKLCSLLDSDEAVLVQSTGIIYLGKCRPKVDDFAALWSGS